MRHSQEPIPLNDPLRRVKDALRAEIIAASGSSLWGSVSGTLSDQSDLQAALDLKLNLYVTRTAGAALGGHRAVYIGADNLAYYANPDPTARFCIGVTTGAAALGAPATIQCDGEMTEGSWSWSASEVIWLASDGILTQTVPTSGHAFQVGVPMGPTRIRIEPQLIAKIS